MPKVVLDTTVAVSAFLNPLPGGASYELLQLIERGSSELFLSRELVDEVTDVLLTRRHLRRRFQYDDAKVREFVEGLAELATMVSDLPTVAIVRDPADDMVIATALAARADYIVTRDKDLLDLREHDGIEIVTPEAFLALLRQAASDADPE